MPSSLRTQRNSYKGAEPRCWITVRFVTRDGETHERALLADTGSPCSVILRPSDLATLQWTSATPVDTNFGIFTTGWLELAMPEFGVTRLALAHGSEAVFRTVQADSPDFVGLAGLPLLRMFNYGGDEDAFWIRKRGSAA
jgi:hypothetical protein